MTKLIPLTRGFSALVDDADFDWLSQWGWLVIGDKYAGRFEGTRQTRKFIQMHRFILNAPPHLEVDHKNRNKLDCQRSNLRLATHAQNMQNKAKSGKQSASTYKGIHRLGMRWVASIRAENKAIWLGRFNSETDAARAYDAAAVHYQGEFACINFPEDRDSYTYSKPEKPSSTSQYRGVSWESNRKGWRAILKVNQKGIHLGVFASEIEAARAYDAKSLEIHGEFAYLNFPQEQP